MAIFNMEDSSLNEFLSEGINISFNEADSQYKHTKKAYKNGGYNVYSSSDLTNANTNNLQNALFHGVKASHKAKDARGTHKGAKDYTPNQRIVNSDNKPVSTERLNAANIARELHKRGVSKEEINKTINKARKSTNEDRAELEEIRKERKLREAAEYILSVLDEMDYLDESENKDLLNNDAFKGTVSNKVKELYKKGKVVSVDSLPDSDEKDTIKRKLK